MATYRKRGSRWRAEICRRGQRESDTFATKAEAVAWATQRESELIGEKLPDHSLGDALDKFSTDVSPARKGKRWEQTRLVLLGRDKIAKVRLQSLTATHIADWRDRRLKVVSGATVRREANLLQAVLGVARREWRWIASDPMRDVKKPSSPTSRKRRISQDEIERITLALGYTGGVPVTISHRIALAFEFAIETAMRSGEILGLRRKDLSEKSVTLPETKNGDVRRVPLSKRAQEIIALMPEKGESVFGINDAQRDALFRKARKSAKIDDLHFHDSRAEAIWRLSKKLDVMELARVIGHRDLNSLLIYYQADADELAAKLG